MVVFIPWTEEECKRGGEWLPRECPQCHQAAVIGHGRRRRQAHDHEHDGIVIRRAICKQCRRTLTVLPPWLGPYWHYSLKARWESVRRYAQPQARLQQCAPATVNVDRIADESTLRRWMGWIEPALAAGIRMLEASRLLWSPTILAWDWRDFRRTLMPEVHSG